VVRIKHLKNAPTNREKVLPCIALLLNRGEENYLLPDPEMPLQRDDRILFTARAGSRQVMSWALNNPTALEYVVTGTEIPDGTIWRWLSKFRTRPL
jgi:hypothetical protein